MTEEARVVSLSFALDVDEGWPPVATESLPFASVGEGEYRLLSVPLFVHDLSVDDVVSPRTIAVDGTIVAWDHVTRSARTTIWLLRLRTGSTIDRVLQLMRGLGCNTAGIDEFGSYAIDVPSDIELSRVDDVLNELAPSHVAVAFPSLRHE